MDKTRQRFHIRCKDCNLPVQPKNFWKHINKTHNMTGVVPVLVESYFGAVWMTDDKALLEKVQ